MSDQIVLAFTVSITETSYSILKAASALAAVPLWANPTNDPVLGQLLGLTVASDTLSQPTSTTVKRTITLNMTSNVGAPYAPPLFPCNPITATPPVPPYPLLSSESLSGSFLTVPGSNTVATSETQIPSLSHGDIVQFLSQLGVFYTVNTVSASNITLTTNYTGPFSEDEGAVLMESAPVTIAAIYSTSPLDSVIVPITPPIPAGSGARSVSLTYYDSTGAGPFTIPLVSLMGKYPAPFVLAAGSKDIAVITDMHIVGAGGFGNSVGQITLCELSDLPLPIPSDATPEEFQALTDQVQMLITRRLVYLPPSYFALAQQGASAPSLVDPTTGLPAQFQVSPNQTSVAVGSDLTGVLAAGYTIEFAVQPGVQYEVATVSPKLVTLTTPFSGEIDNPVVTDAMLVDPSPAAPPTNAQLAATVGEFVNPGTAVPPPNPPLDPQTMSPSPTVLSGLFAKTIQLALAVPVTQAPVAFV